MQCDLCKLATNVVYDCAGDPVCRTCILSTTKVDGCSVCRLQPNPPLVLELYTLFSGLDPPDIVCADHLLEATIISADE